MWQEKIDERIGRLALFQGLRPEQTAELLPALHAQLRQIGPGEPVKWAGGTEQSGLRLGLLLEGRALRIRYDPWGNRSILEYIMPGNLMRMELEEEKTRINTVADTPCTVLAMQMPEIADGLGEGWLRFEQNLLRVTERRNAALFRKLDILSSRSLREKILTYLSYERDIHKSNEFVIPLNRQQLADYLYVDRSSLSSELSRLRQEGLIECRCSRFRLLQASEV